MADLFTCGAGGNFCKLVASFREHILRFGTPAQEILLDKLIPLVEPTINDTIGTPLARVYALISRVAADGSIVLGPELTDSADRRFGNDLQRHRSLLDKRTEHSQLLVSYILSRLSPTSKSALATRVGYESSIASFDAYALWKLVLVTHLYGSGRTKQRYMVDFLTIKQADSHEAFIGDLRVKIALVIGTFESALHSGYILVIFRLMILPKSCI